MWEISDQDPPCGWNFSSFQTRLCTKQLPQINLKCLELFLFILPVGKTSVLMPGFCGTMVRVVPLCPSGEEPIGRKTCWRFFCGSSLWKFENQNSLWNTHRKTQVLIWLLIILFFLLVFELFHRLWIPSDSLRFLPLSCTCLILSKICCRWRRCFRIGRTLILQEDDQTNLGSRRFLEPVFLEGRKMQKNQQVELLRWFSFQLSFQLSITLPTVSPHLVARSRANVVTPGMRSTKPWRSASESVSKRWQIAIFQHWNDQKTTSNLKSKNDETDEISTSIKLIILHFKQFPGLGSECHGRSFVIRSNLVKGTSPWRFGTNRHLKATQTRLEAQLAEWHCRYVQVVLGEVLEHVQMKLLQCAWIMDPMDQFSFQW